MTPIGQLGEARQTVAFMFSKSAAVTEPPSATIKQDENVTAQAKRDIPRAMRSNELRFGSVSFTLQLVLCQETEHGGAV